MFFKNRSIAIALKISAVTGASEPAPTAPLARDVRLNDLAAVRAPVSPAGLPRELRVELVAGAGAREVEADAWAF